MLVGLDYLSDYLRSGLSAMLVTDRVAIGVVDVTCLRACGCVAVGK